MGTHAGWDDGPLQDTVHRVGNPSYRKLENLEEIHAGRIYKNHQLRLELGTLAL